MTHQGSIIATRFPDFIIGGAPKCGTTSLHFILCQNPAIGMPDNEIHYFDADDPVAHPDFLFVDKGRLNWFDPRAAQQDNLNWYASRFAPFRDAPVVGEDSTTYLFSDSAPPRIKALLPDVRLIFLLRDPVKRAYSQYWHLMSTARLSCSFEAALTRHVSIILGSTYAPFLRRYLDVFGPDQVRIAVFEDFLHDKQGFIDGITDYVGAPRMSLETADTWFNRTLYPDRPGLQRMANRLGRAIVRGRYRNHMGQRQGLSERLRNKTHYYWFRHVNPRLLRVPKAPAMRDDTAQYLAQHLSARNAGLSDLLGRDLSQVWPGFEG
ncbi:MAG: sulfotransferase [Marinibacterium sp.]|nr:sulfotransferase [Marinibacterium sp.]